MPGHLLVAGLTDGLPATWSDAALTGLLRGELGFTGTIVCDALEMRAVSDPHGLPEAAVRTVAAGADLLCLGRDQDEQMYLAVRTALAAAVTEGRLPAARLEEAGRRVSILRTWLADHRRSAFFVPAAASDATQAALTVARRALRVSGLTHPPADPLVVEFSPQANIAAGTVPWGLGPWLDGNLQHLDASQDEATLAGAAIGVLATAADRPLVIVVRDAHRHPAARTAIMLLLAAHPDAVVVEMGLPVWHPPGGAYVATYGAARPNAQAAAEVLGLTAH
jgi:beta-N-acetylhexosaminidase